MESLRCSKRLLDIDDDKSAPNDVYLEQSFNRDDVSDLSGSFVSGITAKGSLNGSAISEPKLNGGPWRQAYVASKLPPPKQATYTHSPQSSIRGRTKSVRTQLDGTVELMGHARMEEPIHRDSPKANHKRPGDDLSHIPVTILLMDAMEHSYELLQVWIDRAKDSVRDVFRAFQRGVPDVWKPTYDGLLQVRANRFTQLIFILKMSKYDVQPNEIFVAKPSSMSTRKTTSFAMNVIRHLTNIQVLNTEDEDKLGRRNNPSKSDSAPLMLSSAAQKRLYIPNGMESYLHATQFLTFSPPFDSKFQTKDQLNSLDNSNDEINSNFGSNVSSIGMNSIQEQLVDDLIATFRARTSSQDPGAKKKALPSPVEEADSVKTGATKSVEFLDIVPSRRNVAGVISQLICFKTKQRVGALVCCPPPPPGVKHACCKPCRHAPTMKTEVRTLEFRAADGEFPTLSGEEIEASMFYMKDGTRHIRLMEI